MSASKRRYNIKGKSMAEKPRIGKLSKGLFLTALSAFMFVFLIDTKNAFSDDATGLNEQQKQASASSDMQQKLQQQEAELATLQERVGKLEKTITDQAEIIEKQKQMLDKLITMTPEAKKAFAPPEPKTLVKRFSIDGANLFTAKDFESVLGKYRDKELTMTDLKKAADELTLLYRKKGYVTCMAYVPAQEITDNTVEFKVVEGRVGNIQIEKPKYSNVGNIKREFLVKKGEVLNSKEMEANLRRVNKQPDRTMRAVLSPGATADTSDILLKVDKERSPQHFYASLNNRGTKDTGLTRWGLGYSNNNLLGNDDVLSTRFETNDRDKVYSGSLAYDMPISRYDTRLGAYVAYSRADVAGQFAVLSPEGTGAFWGVYVNHPWLDREFFDDSTSGTLALMGNITAGFDSISVHNKILGAETSQDELRVFKVGSNFDETDNLGRSGLTAEVQVGLPDFFGSMGTHDVKASRLDAGGEFQKYVGSLTRITSFPASVVLINTVKAQFSSSNLVNSAQMLFGGADTIRGFPEADYLADHGWMTTAELRAPLFLLPPPLKVPWDKKHTALDDAVQVLVFIDGGEGYLNNARVGELDHKKLIGTGFGFRLNFYECLRGRLDIGFPVGSQKPSDNSRYTTHFGLEYDW